MSRILSPSCLVCARPLPPIAVHHADPFCRMECARIYHGCPLPKNTTGLRYGKNWRKQHTPTVAEEATSAL